MNIGIIVYSQTGNTLTVAERIKEALSAQGHTVSIERFQAETIRKDNATIRLTAIPDPSEYDALIFGAPVQAFSLDPAMSTYLKQIGPIKKVLTICFITQHFKKPWMGGNRAMQQLLDQIKTAGSSALAIGVINWSNKNREDQIVSLSERCAKVIMENSI